MINKSDLVPATEQERVVPFIRQGAAEQSGNVPDRICIIAANEQIDGQKNHNARQWDSEFGDPGIAALLRNLQLFPVSEKSREFMKSVAQGTAVLPGGECLQCRLARWVIANDGGRTDLETAITQLADELRASARQIISELKSEIPARLEKSFTASFSNWRAAEVASLTVEISRIFNESKCVLQSPEQLATVRRSCEAETSQWLQAESPEMERLVNATAAPVTSRLTSLGFSISTGATEKPRISNNSRESAVAHTAADAASPLHLRLPKWTPPFEWTWRPPVWSHFVPGRFAAQKLINLAVTNLSAALAGYENRLRAVIASAGRQWLEELTVRVDKEINAKVESIRERMLCHSFQDDPGKIQAHFSPVHAIAKTLGGPGAREASGSTAIVDVNIRTNDIVVDESFELRHTEWGSFCPFHTLIFEGVEFRQGMPAGYATTIERTSERLRFIGSLDLERIIASTSSCSACEMLADAQEGFSGTAADSQRKRVHSPLCVLRLQFVLARLKDARGAKDLLLERAAVLERIAADMRLFARKHDSIPYRFGGVQRIPKRLEGTRRGEESFDGLTGYLNRNAFVPDRRRVVKRG